MGVRKGIPEEVTFDLRTERGEGACPPEDSVPGPGTLGWGTVPLPTCLSGSGQ